MPAKNSIKKYVEGGFYHIYNRGVEKRIIFEDNQDYKVFLKYLKEYLSPIPEHNTLLKPFSLRGDSFKGVPRPLKNYENRIELLAYCLMPNHFHLLLKQIEKVTMEGFMRSLATRYSMYFNKRYERVGKLFQGNYKACIVENDNYLLHLSRYIHQNPSEYNKKLVETYSSYAEYLRLRKTKWIKTKYILNYFGKSNSNTYKKFVEGKDGAKTLSNDLILED